MTTAAATATESPCHPTARDDRAYDLLTVLTLLLGGFLVPVVGWLAGVVLLWASPRWTAGQKWLGTLVWPAVVIAPAALGLAAAALSGEATAGVVTAAVVAGLGLLVGLPWVFVRLLRHHRAA